MSGKLFVSLVCGLLLAVAGLGQLVGHATWLGVMNLLAGVFWLTQAFRYWRSPNA
jgi:hypothetical protein